MGPPSSRCRGRLFFFFFGLNLGCLLSWSFVCSFVHLFIRSFVVLGAVLLEQETWPGLDAWHHCWHVNCYTANTADGMRMQSFKL